MNPFGHISYKRAEPLDYEGMAKLQHANFIGNLNEGEAGDGFLSIEYTEKQFDEINNNVGIAVARSGRDVIGYLCGASCSYSKQFPVLNALIRQMPGLTIREAQLTEMNTFIYGPVCIARSFRGSGVLEGLFRKLKEIALPRYAYCLLFISDRNPRSLKGHLKLGMQVLGTFEFSEKRFHIFGASVS